MLLFSFHTHASCTPHPIHLCAVHGYALLFFSSILPLPCGCLMLHLVFPLLSQRDHLHNHLLALSVCPLSLRFPRVPVDAVTFWVVSPSPSNKLARHHASSESHLSHVSHIS